MSLGINSPSTMLGASQPIRLASLAQGTRLNQKTPFKGVFWRFLVVVYHELVSRKRNESSGGGGNRTPVQRKAYRCVYDA